MIRQAKDMVRRILHADDRPAKIAWGVALGLFVAVTPTLGVQMLIAGALAWLLRGNKAVAVTVVWVSNPYTALPIYWFDYFIGSWLIEGPAVDWNWFLGVFHPEVELGSFEYLQYVYGKFSEIFWPLCTGSILVGMVSAAISYPLTYRAVVRYRRFRQKRKTSTNP